MTGPTYRTREELRGLRPEELVAALREGRIDEAAIRAAHAADRAAVKAARLARNGVTLPGTTTDAPTT
ncbi:hypothetical protein AB0N38_04270 [Micromonospora aurantiaca]|uniref:hypothetical protein n=1 Tax=Micromonospora aurantiaca (nom. illeg.) TaxID=47850 RepID=UPI00341DA1BF